MIGNRIRELREKNDINQQDLARYLKVAKSTLSQYETGSRIPNDDIKKAIAEKFNVSVDYLLGLTDIPETIDTYIAKQKQTNKQSAENPYNADEQELIQLYRELPPEGKITIKSLAKTQHDLYVKPKSDEKAI
ncbi:helix-turn-helix domain-containing protein [Megamonas hypermegale]|uniref:helix-turn-helix domain-containing protein n=1 Tax=Megamonas hypermegale TaxID=158847 RepID=UPI00195B1DE4|nr:helix-turn-helix domain-containing protein [Megamonas hypermegale]